MMGKQLIIRRPDDWHVHLRDGAMLGAVTIETARVFARAMVMPNLKNPVVTAKDAAAYRNRIKKAGFGGARFTPMMALYLTDDTNADDLEKAYKGGVVIAAKLYPANATTGAEHGVTDVANIANVLARMEKIDMPLLVHGEVVDGDVDVFDREAVFIERVLAGVMKDFPKLRIVFEHITTKDAVDFVTDGPETLAATVTPHHLVINRSDMFKGGIRPHLYCLPVAKRESHRLALRAATVSGNPKFFLGTDSAPHGIGAKESSCGCAGIFNAPCAMEIYATVFEEEGHLDRLENFASHFGAEFYGLPVNEESLILERAVYTVPEQVDVSGEDAVRPFMAGETLGWRVVGIGPPNKGPVL
jgi:dihydroorotase